MLGTAPGMKHPGSPNPLLNAHQLQQQLQHKLSRSFGQTSGHSTLTPTHFQSLEQNAQGERSNVWRHRGGRSRSAGRYRGDVDPTRKMIGIPKPSHLYTETRYGNEDLLQVSLKKKNKRKEKDSTSKTQNASPSSSASSLVPHTAERVDESDAAMDRFALFGYAERGTALRREQGDALVHVTAAVNGSGRGIDVCFGGSNEYEKVERKQGSTGNVSRLYQGKSGEDGGGASGGSDGGGTAGVRKERPSTAQPRRRMKLKDELLLLTGGGSWSGRSGRSGRGGRGGNSRMRKKKIKRRPKSAAMSGKRSQMLRNSSIPPVSPMAGKRGSNRNNARSASAGRDRKAQALFDRYFKAVERPEDEEEKESKLNAVVSPAGGRRRRKQRLMTQNDRVEEQVEVGEDIGVSAVPGVVKIKKPNWEQWLIK